MEVAERPPVFGRPWMWLAFALVLVAVPLVGYMVRAGLAWEEMHPAINAILNGSSTVFLIAGFFAIRARRIEFHRACMLSAFTTSGVFLASYLARFAMSGVHRYPGNGVDKTIYLLILGSPTLVRSLLRLGLLDELILNICPIVLGSGLHLFDDTTGQTRLELVGSKTYSTGVLRAGYHRADA